MNARLRWLGALLAPLLLISACGGDGGDVEAFCSSIGDAERFESVFDDLDPTDVEAAIVVLDEARTMQEELRTDAPSEVRGDIELQIDFLDELIEGLQATEPGTERPEIYENLRPRFDEVEAAGDRLTRWVDANCS